MTPSSFICPYILYCYVLDSSRVVVGWRHRVLVCGSRGKAASLLPGPLRLAGLRHEIVPGCPMLLPTALLHPSSVAAATAPGLPTASAMSSESGSAEVHPDIPVLQRECDLARGRFPVASVEIDRLRKSLRVVEVARGAIEEEAREVRDATADAQAHAFGEFCSWSCLPSLVFPAFHDFYPQCWRRTWRWRTNARPWRRARSPSSAWWSHVRLCGWISSTPSP